MNKADTRLPASAAAPITALYAEHALGLVRLAVVLLGDRASAEDIVHDAFLGLYRRWDDLPDTSFPLAYLRTSVLNGCRTALRRRSRFGSRTITDTPVESAESRALLSEEQRAVAGALRRLPERQREALVLRYYLDARRLAEGHALDAAMARVLDLGLRGCENAAGGDAQRAGGMGAGLVWPVDQRVRNGSHRHVVPVQEQQRASG